MTMRQKLCTSAFVAIVAHSIGGCGTNKKEQIDSPQTTPTSIPEEAANNESTEPKESENKTPSSEPPPPASQNPNTSGSTTPPETSEKPAPKIKITASADIKISNAPYYHVTYVKFSPPADRSDYTSLKATFTCDGDNYSASFSGDQWRQQTSPLFTMTLIRCAKSSLVIGAISKTQGKLSYRVPLDTKSLWSNQVISTTESIGVLDIPLTIFISVENQAQDD